MTAYAYYIPETKKSDIVYSWADCEKHVKGVNARHKKFENTTEATEWLNQMFASNGKIIKSHDTRVKKKKPILEPGIYCDSGTGRGYTEARVTNEKGENILYGLYDASILNKNGNYTVQGTNNKGELTALYLAILYAMKHKMIVTIYSDSKLVIDFWSIGKHNKELDAYTKGLISLVTSLRKKYESIGGRICHISGDDNPADLGFHV